MCSSIYALDSALYFFVSNEYMRIGCGGGGGHKPPGPDLDGIVAAPGDETSLAAGTGARDDAAGLCGGRPGHGVAADHVC